MSRSTTETETEWTSDAVGMLDAWLNYQAEIHVCGRHLSETMKRVDGTGDRWVGVYDTCEACAAVEKEQRELAKKDRKLEDTGGVPTPSARMWRAMTIPEAKELRINQLKALENAGVDLTRLNLK